MTTKKNRSIWTTVGSVRGCCGHAHRSEDTAYRCLAGDRDGCASQGGYSDRRVIDVSGGDDYSYSERCQLPRRLLDLAERMDSARTEEV